MPLALYSVLMVPVFMILVKPPISAQPPVWENNDPVECRIMTMPQGRTAPCCAPTTFPLTSSGSTDSQPRPTTPQRTTNRNPWESYCARSHLVAPEDFVRRKTLAQRSRSVWRWMHKWTTKTSQLSPSDEDGWSTGWSIAVPCHGLSRIAKKSGI